MTTMETRPVGTTKGFDRAWAEQALERARRAGEPAWSLDARRTAAEIMTGLEFPSREIEIWRRSDFRLLEASLPKLDAFAPASEVRDPAGLPARVRSRVADSPVESAVVVMGAGGVRWERIPASLAQRGVTVSSLDRAVREHGDLVKRHLGAQLAPGYDWYTAAGATLRNGGAFVHVPDGVELTEPVLLFHTLEGAGVTAMPRTVIVLGRGARATVIEELISDTADGIAFHNGASEVTVGEDAKLVHATLEEWGRNVYHYANHRVKVERGGELQWIQTLLGARLAKVHSYFDLAGPGAQAFVHGFMFGDERQHFHLHTLQRHIADHTTSDLLIKGCLKDHARSVYQGLIQVSEGAQRTDAYQANRNLLLSDTARADSIPGLEILANDVRCTHGATIGDVDPEQMYYLMARGLPRADAQRLIVEGFFAPVLDRIPLEHVRDELRQVIERKIG
jgi:Fe-S cluster assembly protein SufD